MKNWFNKLDKGLLNWFEIFGRHAQERRCPAFVVGGFVRDLILGHENLDLDIVIEGDAVGFAESLARLFNASIIVYKEFLTATVILPDGLKIDFVTSRRETYPKSGALPVVTPGPLKDDLFRRDFTINAMAFSLNSQTFGFLVDEFGGFKDLSARRIRVLHKKSFTDDPTRILRAVRFEQRLGFHIEPGTLGLLKTALRKKQEKNVKPERYFEEFRKLFSETRPELNIRRLNELKGLSFLHVPKRFTTSDKFMAKTATVLHDFKKKYPDRKIPEPWLISFMALLDGTSRAALEKLSYRFNLKRSEKLKLASSVDSVKIGKALRAKKLLPSGIYQILKPLALEVILFVSAKNKDKIVQKRLHDFFSQYDRIKLQVNGDDLASLGIQPGKDVGLVLNQLLYDKINGFISTRQDELKKAGQLKAALDRR